MVGLILAPAAVRQQHFVSNHQTLAKVGEHAKSRGMQAGAASVEDDSQWFTESRFNGQFLSKANKRQRVRRRTSRVCLFLPAPFLAVKELGKRAWPL